MTGTFRGCKVAEPCADHGSINEPPQPPSVDKKRERERESKRRRVGGGKRGIGDHLHLQSHASIHLTPPEVSPSSQNSASSWEACGLMKHKVPRCGELKVKPLCCGAGSKPSSGRGLEEG